jgi:hypothetical protein
MRGAGRVREGKDLARAGGLRQAPPPVLSANKSRSI